VEALLSLIDGLYLDLPLCLQKLIQNSAFRKGLDLRHKVLQVVFQVRLPPVIEAARIA